MTARTVNAGDIILADDMSNALKKRIGTAVLTANSANITTTAVQVASMTVNLVNGETYGFRWNARISSSAAADTVFSKLRPTSSSTTEINVAPLYIPVSSGTAAGGYTTDMWTEYTATSTGSMVFVITVERNIGTGTINVKASTSGPAYFTCDYLNS
jgi:hypothetical protein